MRDGRRARGAVRVPIVAPALPTAARSQLLASGPLSPGVRSELHRRFDGQPAGMLVVGRVGVSPSTGLGVPRLPSAGICPFLRLVRRAVVTWLMGRCSSSYWYDGPSTMSGRPVPGGVRGDFGLAGGEFGGVLALDTLGDVLVAHKRLQISGGGVEHAQDPCTERAAMRVLAE